MVLVVMGSNICSVSAANTPWSVYYTNAPTGSHIIDTQYLTAARYYVSYIDRSSVTSGQSMYVKVQIGDQEKSLRVEGYLYTLPNPNDGNSTSGKYTLVYTPNAGSCAAYGYTYGTY